MRYIALIIIGFFLIFTISCTNKNLQNDDKKIVFTKNAPKPIGPYSQAVIADDFIYVSGQIAIDETGEIINGNVVDETRLIMHNISNILKSAGSDLEDVVKVSIFMTDLMFSKEMNQAYGLFFDGKYPARETVQVAALPKNARVEISVIAYKANEK